VRNFCARLTWSTIDLCAVRRREFAASSRREARVFLGNGANAIFDIAWKDLLYLENPHGFLPSRDADRVGLAQLSCVVGDKNTRRSQPTQRTRRFVSSDDTAYGSSPTGDTHSLSSVMVHRAGRGNPEPRNRIHRSNLLFPFFFWFFSPASTSIEYTKEVPCRTLRHGF
jgi:hypothetical protein